LQRNSLAKREEKPATKKISNEDLTKLGFKSIDELASSISEGKLSMNKIKPIKPWFALAPPKRGFKRSTRKTYGEGGVLGKNKDLIELVRKMI